MKKIRIGVTEASRNFADCVNIAVCFGRDLGAALAKVALTEEEARNWGRDLRTARKTLKAPANKW